MGDKVLQQDPVPHGVGHGGDVQQPLFLHMLDLVKESGGVVRWSTRIDELSIIFYIPFVEGLMKLIPDKGRAASTIHK